jgi:hypothetical protein
MERLRPAYLIPTVIEFTGPVDCRLLVAAVGQAMSRHPALRSRFRLNRRSRRVEYCTAADMPPVRLWTVGEDWPIAELDEHIREFSYAPFDLADGPPARADVISAGPLATILVLTVHHIVFDGWSRRLLMADIAEIYQAAVNGRDPVLARPIHPAEVDSPDEADLDSRTAAVVERLSGAPLGVSRLRASRPADDSPLVSALAVTQFDGELTEQMMATALGEGATAFMMAVALLAGTLARLSEQREFLFAVVWPGREDPASHGVVGMLMNTVVLRVGLDAKTTWRELLREARAGALEAFADGDVPLGAVAARLDADRDVSGQPLTPVLINLADDLTPVELAPGVAARFRPPDPMYSIWDLIIFVHLGQAPRPGRELSLTLDYPARLFEERAIDELIAALRRSAMDLANNPEDTVLEPSITEKISDPAARLDIVRSGWREVLEIEEIQDDVGFFDAGGDSLLLVALVETLSKQSGLTLRTMDVFRAGTINGHAALLERAMLQAAE